MDDAGNVIPRTPHQQYKISGSHDDSNKATSAPQNPAAPSSRTAPLGRATETDAHQLRSLETGTPSATAPLGNVQGRSAVAPEPSARTDLLGMGLCRKEEGARVRAEGGRIKEE